MHALCRLGVAGIPRQAGGISRSTPSVGSRDGEVEVRVRVDQRGVDGADRSCVLSQGTALCVLEPDTFPIQAILFFLS